MVNTPTSSLLTPAIECESVIVTCLTMIFLYFLKAWRLPMLQFENLEERVDPIS